MQHETQASPFGTLFDWNKKKPQRWQCGGKIQFESKRRYAKCMIMRSTKHCGG